MDLKVEIYYSGIIRKSWKWRFVASNGKCMGSGRGFNTKAFAIAIVEKNILYFSGGH